MYIFSIHQAPDQTVLTYTDMIVTLCHLVNDGESVRVLDNNTGIDVSGDQLIDDLCEGGAVEYFETYEGDEATPFYKPANTSPNS